MGLPGRDVPPGQARTTREGLRQTMLATILAHTMGGWGMAAFLPVGVILLVGIVLVLGPAFSDTSKTHHEPHDDEPR